MSEQYSNEIRTETTIDQNICAGIVFGETSVLKGDAAILAQARRYIAGVAYKRNGAGVSKPVIPSEDDLESPITSNIWDLCKKAAQDASKDDVGTCKHFVIWYSDDKGKTPSKFPHEINDNTWPYNQIDKITGSWGPFSSNINPKLLPINEVLTEDPEVSVFAATNLYVIKYCGVA